MHIFDAGRRFYGGNAIVGGGLPIAAGLALADQHAAPGPRDGLLLRRRRSGRGRVPRDHEPGRPVAAAGAVLLREQPLRHGHRARPARSPRPTWPSRRPATRCRRGRSTAWTCSPSRTRPTRPPQRSGVAAGRSSWSCGRTGSAPTRCTTRSATGPRRRSRLAPSATRSPCSSPRLTDDGLLAESDIEAIEAEVAAEIDDAVAFAEAGTLEPVEDLTRFVYSERAAMKTTYREAMRAALRDALEPRRARLPDGRGRRPLRRLLRGQPRPAGGVRPRAHPRHTAVGVGLRRRRHRRRPRRHAPDRRDHDRQLQPPGPRPDREQRGHAAAHVGRTAQRAPGHPHDHRRRPPACRPALPQPGGLVRPHPRPPRRRPGHPRGRPGDAVDRTRGPRPGADLRARQSLQPRRRARRRRRTHRHRPRRRATVRDRRDPHHLRRHARQDPGRRRAAGRGRDRRRGHRPAHPAAARHRHDPHLGRPHPPRRRSSTRAGAAAASPPRSAPASREGAFYDLDAPVARVCSAEVPIPYAKHLEDAALPQMPAIVAAARGC